MDWLKSRDPTRYTLQLIGARDRAAVEKYVREQKVEAPYAIFSRPLNGRPWYSLVAGDYADRDAAVAARSRLPGRISRTDVWPRSFASVQENLR
jgi:septal ring-binding cell division protein DamX